MRNIRLALAYDGTDFSGWQIQKSGRTVQGVLQDALQRIVSAPVRVTAAGRTDAGVHATNQVANFYTSRESIPAERFADAINAHLPHDVRVLESRTVPTGFSSRRSAKCRVYRYYLTAGPVGFPHLRRYSYQVRRNLDVRCLNRMASVILGEQDFTVFAAAGDANLSKTRRVVASCFYPAGPYLVYEIAADAFLWKMVRSIVGTIIELATSGGDEQALADTLASGDRSRAGQTAPARGLFLEKVVYDSETFFGG